MNNNILTNEEIKMFRSMSFYWNEVRERDDMSPLAFECHTAYQKLGYRLLDLIENYLDQMDKET